jgi:hypothetical protein
MTVTFPRDLVLEAFLGRWVDITALAEGRTLRQVEPITHVWGLPGEQSGPLAPPSTVEGALNNQGGHWTPGNPVSDYYDYLQGRNVPTRFSLRVSRDAFGRTLPSTLGSTDTGESWNTSGFNDTYSVGSGVGNITISVSSSFGVAIIGDSYPDCEARITFDVGSVTPTGAPIEPGNPVVRFQTSGAFIGEHYMLRVEVRTDNTLWVSIHHSTLGSISGGLVPAGLTNAPGRKFRTSLYAEGQTLRGQIWDASNLDRPGFIVTAHHDRLTGGFPGFRAGVASGNTNAKPFTMAHDDWELRLVRHSGELSKLQPEWDTSHKIKTASFKLADITQRLGRPNKAALSSSPRRYVGSTTDFTATDFWPLDEPSKAPRQGLNTVPGGNQALFLRSFPGTPSERGAINWGVADERHSAVPAVPTLSNDGTLFCTTQQASLGSSWSVMWAMRLSPDAGGVVFLSVAGVTNRYAFWVFTDGTWSLFSNPSGSTVASGRLSPAGLDGQWVTVGVTAFPAGAEMDARVFVNGANMGGGLIVADAGMAALRDITLLGPQAITGGQGDAGFSSVVVTNTRLDAFVGSETVGFRAHRALMGYIGETSGARAARLCAEEGVLFDYYGDPAQTRTMGPQTPKPLLTLLTECAVADGAFLFAPRYSGGVALRGRRSMAARSPDVTLLYASGHVAPPFATSADDRPTANLVKAERTTGGSLIIEQTTGPMNTKDPAGSPIDAEAVGRTPDNAEANIETDAQLGDLGGWVKNLGTTPEIRFPRVTVNLRARELTTGADPTLPARTLIGTHPVGDRLLITGLAAADVYRDLDQMIRGGREVFTSVFGHTMTLNTAPYEKWKAGVFGNSSSRYAGVGTTTLDAQLTSGTTGARNITTAGMPWTTTAGAFPLQVLIGGEVMTISGITGTGLAAQVMTISARNVNVLPIAGGKTHAAGTKIYLFDKRYYA